jgi:hypothetical protein
MKTTTIILAAVVIAIIGYLVFMPKSAATETPMDTASESKLDVNTVCDGALAYMTFPDAASAEAFVSECKEGKHPEVIEKYRADMNLGAGAQI